MCNKIVLNNNVRSRCINNNNLDNDNQNFIQIKLAQPHKRLVGQSLELLHDLITIIAPIVLSLLLPLLLYNELVIIDAHTTNATLVSS
jgi:hypothetical protein